MPFDGNGTFNPAASSVVPALSGTVIDETDFNALVTELAAALTKALLKDGQSTASAVITFALGVQINNTGLKVLDTDASHYLSIVPGSNLTAARTLTLTTGDAARTLDISAASVTVSAYGATLVDDADAATARATLGAAFSGAMVEKSADHTTADYTTATALTFNQESYDVGGWHDNASNNTRLTVPSGVTYVRVGANVTVSATTADTWKTLQLFKNGSAAFDGACGTEQEVGDTGCLLSISSGVIAVVATDYFEVKLREESDASITVTAAQTNFWIEAVSA